MLCAAFCMWEFRNADNSSATFERSGSCDGKVAAYGDYRGNWMGENGVRNRVK